MRREGDVGVWGRLHRGGRGNNYIRRGKEMRGFNKERLGRREYVSLQGEI